MTGDTTECRVLVIDDDEDSRDALAALLTDAGFWVATAPDAEEAWVILRKGPRPDVIVLDLLLPDVDGWDFRANQKRDPEFATIPVVAVSGVGKLIDAAHSLRKPLDPEELLGILAELC